MKCKRILAAIMSMGLVATSLTTAVSAADLSFGNVDIVEPAYVIANEAVSRVTISGTTASCYRQQEEMRFPFPLPRLYR